MFSKLRSRPWLLLVPVALLLAATGVAYAAIPDATGVIHGCFSKSKGALRVVDTEQGELCSSNETGLDWNQTGPPGPQGPGAQSITFVVPAGGQLVTVMDLANGILIRGACGVNESTVVVDVDPSAVVPGVSRGNAWGYKIDSEGLHPVLFLGLGGISATGVLPVISVVAGISSTGGTPPFARIDIEGAGGGGLNCKFDAMITRSN